MLPDSGLGIVNRTVFVPPARTSTVPVTVPVAPASTSGMPSPLTSPAGARGRPKPDPDNGPGKFASRAPFAPEYANTRPVRSGLQNGFPQAVTAFGAPT